MSHEHRTIPDSWVAALAIDPTAFIAPGARVSGCTIGDDCLVGMGAIVLSRARIGAGSLIGAGALVREGQEIPPGSLAVGTPARVVGAVGPQHLAAIRDGTAHYADLAL